MARQHKYLYELYAPPYPAKGRRLRVHRIPENEPWSVTRERLSPDVIDYRGIRAGSMAEARATAKRLEPLAGAERTRRSIGGYHSHPTHPYSHPRATRHRRK
jgi:hypothetical protein